MDSIDPSQIAYVPSTGVRKMHEAPMVLANEEQSQGLRPDRQKRSQVFPDRDRDVPAQGRRPIDKNSGDQGGVTEGIFQAWWSGDTLYAKNGAVGDSYLFAWSKWPEEAANTGPTSPRQHALIWRAQLSSRRRPAFLAGPRASASPCRWRRRATT